MAAERSTKVQVQAYRFGVRRVERAVQSGVSYQANLHGPRHGVAMVIGLVVAGLVLAGFAVYGFIKPAPSIGDAKVLVDTDSGSAFVVRDGKVHPALNLASAMLAAESDTGAAGSSAGSVGRVVRQVNTATLAELPKGQLLGIPGAPHQVPTEASLVPSAWTVCDMITVDPDAAPGMTVPPQTTVAIGLPQGAGGSLSSVAGASLLVTPDGKAYYLLFDGVRARVEDPGDRQVAEGLGLDVGSARRISVGLLNVIPEAPQIRRPVIADAGKTISLGGRSASVGDVVRVNRAAGGPTYQLVLGDGVQEIGPVVADLVRAVTGQGPQVPLVSPSDLAALGATSNPLDVAAYPRTRPSFVSVDAAPGLCVGWRIDQGRPVREVGAVDALPLPADAVAVPAPPTTETSGVGGLTSADAVYLPPGRGIVIGQATDGVTPNLGNLFLVTDQGIKFPVVDLAALQSLGLGKTIQPAPAELVSLLPLGPTLDPAAARRFFGAAPGANG